MGDQFRDAAWDNQLDNMLDDLQVGKCLIVTRILRSNLYNWSDDNKIFFFVRPVFREGKLMGIRMVTTMDILVENIRLKY